jgi:tellurite resistance protein TerC
LTLSVGLDSIAGSMTLGIVFAVVVLGMVALDLFVIHRKPHEVSLRESLFWVGLWVFLAVAFGIGVYFTRGHVSALEFFAAYLVEQSLSIDNLFVFLLLFVHFKVPARQQHKVLFWGILGALIMRFVFILAGIKLLTTFHWVLYIFGAILVWSGIQMFRHRETEIEPEKSPVLRIFRRFFPVTPRYHGDRFFLRRMGHCWATPLFLVLLMVETTDLVFAVDSIPAVLAISHDPFIVYTSNVFAILGLRSMFFALAHLLKLFHYLHYGLAVILVFVGFKMLIAEFVKIPIVVTLSVVIGVIAVSTVASILTPRPPGPDVEA